MALNFDSCTTLLQVYDMPTSVAFYRDVLGFTVAQSSKPGDDFDWGLLTCGAIAIMLNTAYDAGERPATPDSARVVAHQDTSLFFGCSDLDSAYAHLRAHGIEVNPPATAPYGMRQLWLRDPDGYVICFQMPAT